MSYGSQSGGFLGISQCGRVSSSACVSPSDMPLHSMLTLPSQGPAALPSKTEIGELIKAK